MEFSVLLKQFGDQGSPSGLVTGADSPAGVAVEVLVKRNQVMPVRVRLEQFVVAEHWPPSFAVVEKDPREPS
jgi:hypothetical protein